MKKYVLSTGCALLLMGSGLVDMSKADRPTAITQAPY